MLCFRWRLVSLSTFLIMAVSIPVPGTADWNLRWSSDMFDRFRQFYPIVNPQCSRIFYKWNLTHGTFQNIKSRTMQAFDLRLANPVLYRGAHQCTNLVITVQWACCKASTAKVSCSCAWDISWLILKHFSSIEAAMRYKRGVDSPQIRQYCAYQEITSRPATAALPARRYCRRLPIPRCRYLQKRASSQRIMVCL